MSEKINRVRSSKDYISVFKLDEMIKNERLIFDQPITNLKDKLYKSEVIQSILMRIPLPIIYTFEDNKGAKIITKGRKLIASVHQFLNNEFALSATNFLPGFEGKKFSDIKPIFRSAIEDYQFLIITIQPPTLEVVKDALIKKWE